MKNIWKKIIWFILVLLSIIFGIWKIITYKDKPFNKVEIEYNNFIHNTTNMKFLDTILHVGLNEFKIDSTQILIRLLTNDVLPPIKEDIEYKAIIQDFGKKYILWIVKLNKKESFTVISHELVHIKQYYYGELSILNGVPLWKDEIFDINTVDYFNRPWEKEAFNKQGMISKNFKKILYE